jgi:hypothetical protein
VAARGGRDLDGGPSQGLQLGGRPGLEAAGVAAQSAGPVGGGEDDAGRREQGAAGGVEVVAVVQADADKRQALHAGVIIATYQLERP